MVKYFKADFSASIVVFLIALPLCLGIALASKAPLFSGIISGIVGGIVVGFISGSNLSVSGPAAGLASLVATAIVSLGSFETFLLAVFLAGFIQIIFGVIKAGNIGNYFPSSVIKGMLAAIGLILILKQLPHAVGYDFDTEGDENFIEDNGHNTFSDISEMLDNFTPGCIVVSLISLAIMLLWDKKYIKNKSLMQIPAAIIVVLFSSILAWYFRNNHILRLDADEHFVNLPHLKNFAELQAKISFPNFNQIANPAVWTCAFTIAIIASLESLLSIDAIDKIDPKKRITPLNKELLAQGSGNLISGLLGGLPITAVIVRGSANTVAGAQTKLSSILHGVWLMISVAAIPFLLNYIPLSALAIILILTGFKLINPSLIKSMRKKGLETFIPFLVTIIAILFSNLLTGILIGMFVGMIFIFKNNIRKSIVITQDGNNYMVRFIKDVTFFNKTTLRSFFQNIPENSSLLIDRSKNIYVDQDIEELISEFKISTKSRKIELQIIEKKH